MPAIRHRAFDPSRTVVLGNSGSGKSWFAARLSAEVGASHVDLDEIHWEPGRYGARRAGAVALAMVEEAASSPTCVIEGVYGWLAAPALHRATALIWLDLPVEDCLAAVRGRGPRRGGDQAALDALLAWAASYPHRTTSSSHAGHLTLFETFGGAKMRLHARRDVDALVSPILTA